MESHAHTDYSRTGMPKIMVVDDEQVIRDFFRRIAELVKVDLYEAADGRRAIELTQQCACDVYFIDMRMPEMNGLQTALAVRERAPQAKIIIMTGYAVEDLLQKARESGFEVVRKPFDVEGMIEYLKNFGIRVPEGRGEVSEQ